MTNWHMIAFVVYIVNHLPVIRPDILVGLHQRLHVCDFIRLYLIIHSMQPFGNRLALLAKTDKYKAMPDLYR